MVKLASRWDLFRWDIQGPNAVQNTSKNCFLVVRYGLGLSVDSKAIANYWFSVDGTKIPAVYGAKPKTDSQMKCVVMSHGLGGCRFLYSNICCELASRGFLVVALEHR